MYQKARREADPDSVPILHQCDDFIVINKPYDVKVNSNLAEENTVETILLKMGIERTDQSAKKLTHSFHWIHRLDYATSGVLLIGLSKVGSRVGFKSFFRREAHKQYLALVRGHVDLETVALNNPHVQLNMYKKGLQYITITPDIVRDRSTDFPFLFTTSNRKLNHQITIASSLNMTDNDCISNHSLPDCNVQSSHSEYIRNSVEPTSIPVTDGMGMTDVSNTDVPISVSDTDILLPAGKPDVPVTSCTLACLLETGMYDGEKASKLLLQPLTGRSHQLRVHCKYIGHTIVGDYTYSMRQDVREHRMMLHAYRLSTPLRPLIEHLDIYAPDPFLEDDKWQTIEKHSSIEQFSELEIVEKG